MAAQIIIESFVFTTKKDNLFKKYHLRVSSVSLVQFILFYFLKSGKKHKPFHEDFFTFWRLASVKSGLSQILLESIHSSTGIATELPFSRLISRSL